MAFELARAGVPRAEDVRAVTSRACELVATQTAIPPEFTDYVGEQVALALFDRPHERPA
jgi:hypothetical protein